MLQLTPFKEMLEGKWKKLKKPFNLWRLWYALYLFVLTLAIALRPMAWESDYAPTLLVLGLELIVFIHFLLSTYFELRDLYFLGWEYWSIFFLFTVVMWVSNIFFTLALGFRLTHQKVTLLSISADNYDH